MMIDKAVAEYLDTRRKGFDVGELRQALEVGFQSDEINAAIQSWAAPLMVTQGPGYAEPGRYWLSRAGEKRLDEVLGVSSR